MISPQSHPKVILHYWKLTIGMIVRENDLSWRDLLVLVLDIFGVKKKKMGMNPYVRYLCLFPVFKNPPFHGKGVFTRPLPLSTCRTYFTYFIGFHIFQGRGSEVIFICFTLYI
jgi:hypothetical protein